MLVWVAGGKLLRNGKLRARAAHFALVLGLLWFGIGVACRIDPRFNELFVYFGLGVNACLLADFLARSGPPARRVSDWLLVAAIAGSVLFPVLRAWPILTVSGEDLHGSVVSALVAETMPSDWLPWCSRRLFGVAHAAMATSASSAMGLAVLTVRPVAGGSVPRIARIEAAFALLGVAAVLVIHILVGIERCSSSSCR